MFCVMLLAIAFLAGVQGLNHMAPTTILLHPYQAAVLRRHWDTPEFRFACSGAIVSQTFVLTTASCAGDPYEDYRVRVGSSYHQSGGELHRLRDVFRHPNFTADLDSDIALLKLADNLKLSHRVAVVNIPNQDVELTGPSNGWEIISWEFDSNASLVNSTRLLEIVSDCNIKYKKYSKVKITDNMFCLQHINHEKSPCCERDQGALLVVAGTLHGLSSWSCCLDSPSVFTKISAFTTWIQIILRNESWLICNPF